jgi:hypothetical protein
MLACIRRMLSYIRSDPAAAFGRFAAILCGIALTWASAAIGLMIVTSHPHYCYGGGKIHPATLRVRRIESAVDLYQIEHDRCPPTRDALVANGYLSASELLDPWGRSIAYWCAEDETIVTSAGPDGAFGTEDDIKYPD